MSDIPRWSGTARERSATRDSVDASGGQRSVVVDPGGGRWDLVSLLQLRAALPGVSLEFVPGPTDADTVAAAFRAGADAYVVGSGDVDADGAFVAAACAAPPYRPAS
jgi:hypothetical protein